MAVASFFEERKKDKTDSTTLVVTPKINPVFFKITSDY